VIDELSMVSRLLALRIVGTVNVRHDISDELDCELVMPIVNSADLFTELFKIISILAFKLKPSSFGQLQILILRVALHYEKIIYSGFFVIGFCH
jgi:hypothetical protein